MAHSIAIQRFTPAVIGFGLKNIDYSLPLDPREFESEISGFAYYTAYS
jgi:hypothetical protein